MTGGTVDAQGSDDGSGIGGGSAYQEPYDKGAGGTLDIKDVIVFASSATE
ncbi:MAG: hypothetical protein LBL36_06985, partial [Clostridiales Family XIII bacterium]|nr:hypothetical protein [Clostridiales Family XIII bacterium]